MPMYTRRPYLPNPIGIAEDIKKQLAEIGIRVIIEPPRDETDFWARSRKGTYDIALYGWISDFLDPDGTFSALLAKQFVGTANLSRYANPQFDDLLMKARSQSVPGERLKLYKSAQSLFPKDLPFEFLELL